MKYAVGALSVCLSVCGNERIPNPESRMPKPFLIRPSFFLSNLAVQKKATETRTLCVVCCVCLCVCVSVHLRVVWRVACGDTQISRLPVAGCSRVVNAITMRHPLSVTWHFIVVLLAAPDLTACMDGTAIFCGALVNNPPPTLRPADNRNLLRGNDR